MSDIRIQRLINIAETAKVSAKQKKEGEEPKVEEQKTPATNYKSADEVLNHMSNSAAFGKENVKAPRKIEVSNYVTEEQAARIGAAALQAMDTMFNIAAEGVKNGLSPKAAEAIAPQVFDNIAYGIEGFGEKLIQTA